MHPDPGQADQIRADQVSQSGYPAVFITLKFQIVKMKKSSQVTTCFKILLPTVDGHKGLRVGVFCI